MTKFFSSKLYKMLVICVIIYAIYIFNLQQEKLNTFAKDKQYYESQIEDLQAKNEELLETKENVNSPEYIEKIAREKLEMYLPNERVYVDISK